MSSEAKTQETQSEQILYAKVLGIGMSIGLVTLFLTFGLVGIAAGRRRTVL